MDNGQPSFNHLTRRTKRDDVNLYNCLCSIKQDSLFVSNVAGLFSLPVYANLRCGLWYVPPTPSAGSCYFKSTDGHVNRWDFSTARLNLQVALRAAHAGGALVVDATRSSTKRIPDALSKTVPIWCAVLNHAVARHRAATGAPQPTGALPLLPWDGPVRLPPWLPEQEAAAIAARLPRWVAALEATGADIGPLAAALGRPLAPLWVSPETPLWTNRWPPAAALPFTPIVAVSASAPLAQSGPRRGSPTAGAGSYCYVPGAGDDEESWSLGLTPLVMWAHADALMAAGPGGAPALAAALVAQGTGASHGGGDPSTHQQQPPPPPRWLPRGRIAVASVDSVAAYLDSGGNGGGALACVDFSTAGLAWGMLPPSGWLHVPAAAAKAAGGAFRAALPRAMAFGAAALSAGSRLLLCCDDGRDRSVAAALAVAIACGEDEPGHEGDDPKLAVRRLLARLSAAILPDAYPSRASLKIAAACLSQSHALGPEGDEGT